MSIPLVQKIGVGTVPQPLAIHEAHPPQPPAARSPSRFCAIDKKPARTENLLVNPAA